MGDMRQETGDNAEGELSPIACLPSHISKGLRGARNNGQSAVHVNPGRYERSSPLFLRIENNEQRSIQTAFTCDLGLTTCN